eukprot:TRINITY_DN21284_c0_g1_i1.p1 TRINITY_DN21284_c0_g1~~TRINITY_DN21284_c0_g1_i1.p1  ORF type:complete len:136 (+),score=11.77 TRINITY_DN21284_c0_g1_i1:48-455(+)
MTQQRPKRMLQLDDEDEKEAYEDLLYATMSLRLDDEKKNYECVHCKKQWWAFVGTKCYQCKKRGTLVPSDRVIGLGHFRCTTCTRTFVGKARGDVSSKCHSCGTIVLPHEIGPPGEVKKKSNHSHNCQLCGGTGT